MHIAMIGQKGIPARFGGVERHVHDLSTQLVKQGIAVTVYSRAWYTQGKDETVEGVMVKLIPTLRSKHLDTIVHTFLSTIHAMRHTVDIIHYHGIGPSLVSWLPRLFTPHITIITTFHSVDRKHEKWGWFARTILKFAEWTACTFAHRTIAISTTIAQYARDVYDTETAYIPNGICTAQSYYGSNALAPWNVVPGKYIIMVSRLIPHKGAHYLIDGFLQAKKQAALADIKLVVVGDGFHTDEYVASLKEKTNKHPDIIFTGFLEGDALKQLTAHARLMVHPSDQEGLPVTVLEGMSYGLPVLLSDIPEHKQLLQKEQWLFRQGNPTHLTKQLISILNADHAVLEESGEQNRTFVNTSYNWEILVHRVIETYKETQAIQMLRKQTVVQITK